MSTEDSDETVKTEPDEATSDLQQYVTEIKEAVDEVPDEQKLTDKVEGLRLSLDNLSSDVDSWKTKQKNDLLGALESIKFQVEEIEQEWDGVSKSMKAQRERLEALLETFPSVIETSTIRALALRLNHLENLVANLTDEKHKRVTVKSSHWQMVISIIALSVTVFFWVMLTTGRISW